MLNVRLTFKPNPRGMRKVEQSPELGRVVDRQTRRIARAVRDAAPVLTGRFARSIRARPAQRSGRTGGWIGKVTTSDPFWHLEEYGSRNNAPHRSFERGVRAAGLRFRDHR